MSAPAAPESWHDPNQRRLVAEFARLRAALGGEPAPDAPAVDAGADEGPAAVDWVVELFGLSPFERDVLLLCAGAQMDGGVAACCAAAQGGARHAAPTFALALATLDEPHWSAVAPVRPLRRWRLVEVEEGSPPTTAPLRIDERMLHFLAGVGYLDPRLHPLLRRREPPGAAAGGHAAHAAAAAAALRADQGPRPLVQLWGDDPQGQEDVAALAAAALGLQLYVLRAGDLPAGAAELDAFCTLWDREAALLPGALLVQCDGAPAPPALAQLAERTVGLVFSAAREPVPVGRPTLRLQVDKPGPLDQKRLWEQALGPAAAELNGALDALAAQFRLSARAILAAGAEAGAALRDSDRPDRVLWGVCRALGRPRLEELAQRIEPAAGWDDLVLPPAQEAVLRQVAAHVRRRVQVYERWGFAARGRRGLGITALFAGESGTGKTMAAEVLAGELELDLFRIDLSAVVSKYIGETEKNLEEVFEAAGAGNVVLFFDEADALFGKRSEVKDSHDRYANIEVSYLLQRMEAYRGLAILTTNQKQALDTAFQRRLRFVVSFPFPDAEQRQEIWRRAFPPQTPARGVDPERLAQLHVAGGSIRNIALSAAFLAADQGGPVEMGHLLQAAHGEYAKLDRPLSDAETRGWV
ncbi:MAG TPA: ATP-binding protein [Longimicrobium sp.]|nr:ATP-binding protein [Longimicrobium sp.]